MMDRQTALPPGGMQSIIELCKDLSRENADNAPAALLAER
jgi:hypothetical protein